MRILIDDGFQIQCGTGIGQHSQQLFKYLKTFNHETELVKCKKISKNDFIKRINYLKNINFDYINYYNQYDVIHFTNYAIPFKRKKNGIFAVTIHDLASFKFPETLPLLYRNYNRVMIKNAINNADVVVTVSKTIKEELLEMFPSVEKKVEVLYSGVRKQFYKMDQAELHKLHISDFIRDLGKLKFFLFVGTIEKRKNVDFLIRAFFKAKSENESLHDYKLVLAGRTGFESDEIKKVARNNEFADEIIFTGYITENELLFLYNTTQAYIFPTVYEGFGTPQLECMACRTPILLSDIKTNHEISEEYGEYFDLYDISSLVEKMKLIGERNYVYQEKGLIAERLLKKYNWETIANNHICVYKKYLRKSGNEC